MIPTHPVPSPWKTTSNKNTSTISSNTVTMTTTVSSTYVKSTTVSLSLKTLGDKNTAQITVCSIVILHSHVLNAQDLGTVVTSKPMPLKSSTTMILTMMVLSTQKMISTQNTMLPWLNTVISMMMVLSICVNSTGASSKSKMNTDKNTAQNMVLSLVNVVSMLNQIVKDLGTVL